MQQSGKGLLLGFDEFEKDMESIIKEVSDPEVMHEMLEAMAKPIVEDAKKRAKGNGLKNGIVSKWSNLRPTEITIGWTNDAFYGRMLETGYHHIGTGQYIKMAHIRPAYDAKIDEGKNAALDVFRTNKYYTK